MIAIKTADLRDFKRIADCVVQGEKVLISRPRNENIVMITEKEYNELDKLREKNARAELMTTIRALQKSAVESGTDEMSIEEINAEIAKHRQEKRKKRG
ncbi:MAG: type II toxin-antitoxin system Phd/YefM family antitoxin [Firmicutes bacterium]|nr:type II toxin-antitoxin system Phd/YefM family antitoxin [Bacillota bacterium]